MRDPARVAVPPAGYDPGGIAALFEALDAGVGAVRPIGGWVRDSLRGEAPADLDVATRLSPTEVVTRIERAGLNVWTSPSGLAHGTVGVVVGGRPVEVTTLRRDVSTDGRRATVAFTEDWREDAARRDFTINALSADPLTGEVFDYFGGVDDLAAGRVRFIGDPLIRIAEDHLRILRFFRFHARFGRGEPDPAGLAACVERANDLMALSRERIADELLKLLALPDPAPAVTLMVENGLFLPVLPDIDAGGVARLAKLVAREVAYDVPPHPLRRFGALLPRDPGAVKAVAERLKLSNIDQKRLVAAAAPQGARADRPRQLVHQIGRDPAIDWLLIDAGGDGVEELLDWTQPRFPLSGGDLIALGLTPGPIVAATLQALEREWVESDFPDSDWVRAKAREKVQG